MLFTWFLDIQKLSISVQPWHHRSCHSHWQKVDKVCCQFCGLCPRLCEKWWNTLRNSRSSALSEHRAWSEACRCYRLFRDAAAHIRSQTGNWEVCTAGWEFGWNWLLGSKAGFHYLGRNNLKKSWPRGKLCNLWYLMALRTYLKIILQLQPKISIYTI